ncbi:MULTISPECIES: NAD-dependent epimerase/dehydratase family protein [Prochlorococcus]|uniref:Nucleoside-diphosphate-sugar epimerase n=1 Tax=Prochlorococcus marinus (strain SARG / CCMP1375 / SS120) TaxID=167539 RepID=Q7VCQ9_PROMA|nr:MULTISPECIES: NAD-dependent epimerase/dehydratase family protein [Prochlorococcus]AAP99725.1 Nucleoside-diphosphate-sugar epimerase [Prochlorococcus marinus subsp. marinus str. CCMP1375]KGG22580.1 hypothetical protein EV08_0095 [Prochlorococcus marinus str. SS2]KGG24423.1 hypothetical protein EV09_0330 [Prochlorococcus marinus str. SS35]KGG14430.1 hypothetical protein EV04_0007 [Prochlorococcus marinus str. LG]KGG34196.1 hypothetical protein EV10_0042 [Prochlorococcus marinus str. SS51]
MRILFTGLSGLTGSHLAKLLLKNGLSETDQYFCIVRSALSSYISLPSRVLCKNNFFYGDCEDEIFCTSVIKTVQPDLVVHLAQMKLLPVILKSTISLGIKPRIVVLGTTAVYSSFMSCSQPYKIAENFLTTNWDNFLVIRSSMIYGHPIDKNMNKLFRYVKRRFPIPIPNDGKALYQPIFYKDLAEIIYSLLFKQQLKGYYDLPGPDTVSLKAIIRLISSKLKMKPITFSIPIKPALYTMQLLEIIASKSRMSLPINSEQILRSSEDKICDSSLKSILPSYQLTSIDQGLEIQKTKMNID